MDAISGPVIRNHGREADGNGDFDGANGKGNIETSGCPLDWQGPGPGFSAVQVSANSRGGLPARGFTHALAGTGTYRTDRLGTVELLSNGDRFQPADP